ncbi:ATP synthase gamma chain [Buchnera aphidicola (Thelaxes suberi)]|uniref:F0F1 ATP synthase subunit gamma n=1 Tax=Buchnera aphidicola TaxID=9 RepID=UPI003463C339
MPINIEIKNKIHSIENTQKITKAMEMISIAKMKKTQCKMEISRPYANILNKVISHVSQGYLEYKHPFLYTEKKIKKNGYIILSTDKGLCGSLNTNLFKKILDMFIIDAKKNIFTEIILLGSKGSNFFESLGYNILDKTINIGENPSFSTIITFAHPLIQAYKNQKIQKLYICYNHFHNRLSQHPIIKQLLPFPKKQTNNYKKKIWDYIYEPNAKYLLNLLLNRYLEFQIYQSVLENLASEQAARMVAMNTANNNSTSMIKDLQLIYNKSRQSNITQEITEIISGSNALSKE